MNNLLQLLKRKQKHELKYGIVRQVITKDYKVKVELESGLKTWVRYNGVLTSPKIGDAVLIGGSTIQLVIQSINGIIPKSQVISNV